MEFTSSSLRRLKYPSTINSPIMNSRVVMVKHDGQWVDAKTLKIISDNLIEDPFADDPFEREAPFASNDDEDDPFAQ